MTPETLYARTEDNWALALHHYPGRGAGQRHPVLCIHGIAANRLHFDLDERYSFARAARARGFTVYLLELRGAGLSRAPGGRDRLLFQWGFADYAERDVPTAIATVLEHAGVKSLHAVGHSMGGMLCLCGGVQASSEVRSITTVGTPLVGQLGLGLLERRLLQLAGTLGPATTFTPPSQKRVPLRVLVGAATRFVPFTARLADGILLNGQNTEPEVVRRMAREGIADVPIQMISEITSHAAGSAAGGPYAYESRLYSVRAPTLALAGSADRVAPPASVRQLCSKLQCQDLRYRELGTRFGDRADYGHVDLLVGRNAPEEVYPLILDFLEEVD
ncbi:MAG: alpha/beta fold hydrolase [Deltaproteobacteria bacterium]|nr:MAG: alpha/beta fold hydrolase [Deltaproteobacteria bacterium]